MKLSASSQKKLADLHPEFKALIEKLIPAVQAAGLDVQISYGYRTMDEQTGLYAKGRTTPGPRVTNAKAGESPHNYKAAVDFFVMKEGKAVWDLKDFGKIWEIAVELGLDKSGLVWGNNFSSIKDPPHFEWLEWKNLK